MTSPLNYFPKTTSDANTVVVQMKNNGKSVKEIQTELMKFVLQALVNEESQQIGRGAFILCPNHKPQLNYNFSLLDTALIGVAIHIIEYSMGFSKLETIPSLPLDIEEMWDTDRPKRTVFKKKKGSSDNSIKRFKTEKELSDEAEDGCGGACTI